MTARGSWDKEIFLHFVEDSGLDLDVDTSHLKDLYAYLDSLRPILKAIENLDLEGLEPFMPSLGKKEKRS